MTSPRVERQERVPLAVLAAALLFRVGQKLEAIRRHASQIGDLKAVEARTRNRAVLLGKEKS